MKIDSALKSAFRRHKDALADANIPLNEVLNNIIEDVWDVLLSRRIAVDASRNGGKHRSFTLEALANKFEKESFICDGGPTPWIWRERLRIELPNGKYYFSRLDICTTYASPLGFYLWTTRSINCTLSCDSMARFIKEFDLIIPEIIKKTSIEKKEERRQNIIENIENTTISEMVDSTMNLLGIKKYGNDIHVAP